MSLSQTVLIVTLLVIALWVSLVAQMVMNLPAVQETWIPSPDWKDSLKK